MSDWVLNAVANLAYALFLVGGVYIYLAIVRQVSARTPSPVIEGERTFGLPEALVALGLAALFIANAFVAASRSGKQVLGARDLIANALISLALFLLLAAFLKFRGISVNALAGLSHLPVWRAIVTGIILVFAAHPLIVLGDLVSRMLGAPSSRQGIVEMFSESQSIEERVLIITMAVAIAPLVEEFVFRFFFYGVLRRYVGRFAGLLANSVLFAAVHAHLPAAAPLFVLGVCLTLAYEWSGSILVPMTMHALFNSLTLVALAFPEVIPQ